MIQNKNNIYQGSRERKSLYDVFYEDNGIKKPVIIFSHGFKGFKDHGCFDLMAKYWAEKNFVFIKFNFSYNGGTIDQPIDFPDLDAFGQNNYTTELDDLDIMITKTLNGELVPLEEIDTDKVYLMGHSRGGGITILKGIEDLRIKKFVTLGAISDLNRFKYPQEAIDHWKREGVYYFENMRTKQMMPLYYQFYQNYKENEKRLSIQDHIQHLDKPYLCIHGSADETINMNEALLINSWSPAVELYLIENANHAFGSIHPWTSDQLPEDFQVAMDNALAFFRK